MLKISPITSLLGSFKNIWILRAHVENQPNHALIKVVENTSGSQRHKFKKHKFYAFLKVVHISKKFNTLFQLDLKDAC